MLAQLPAALQLAGQLQVHRRSIRCTYSHGPHNQVVQARYPQHGISTHQLPACLCPQSTHLPHIALPLGALLRRSPAAHTAPCSALPAEPVRGQAWSFLVCHGPARADGMVQA